MTREEAIEQLKQIPIHDAVSNDYMKSIYEAIEIAIKALEHPERNIISVIPCGDTISRQAAIDAIGNVPDHDDEMVWEALSHAQRNVALLPLVTPQPKIGRWIEVIDETDSLGNKTWHHECSICGSGKSGWGTYKHCPDCGTKMEVKE